MAILHCIFSQVSRFYPQVASPILKIQAQSLCFWKNTLEGCSAVSRKKGKMTSAVWKNSSG